MKSLTFFGLILLFTGCVTHKPGWCKTHRQYECFPDINKIAAPEVKYSVAKKRIIDSLNIEKAAARIRLNTAILYYENEKRCGAIADGYKAQYYKTGDKSFGSLYNKYVDSVYYWAAKVVELNN